MSDSSRGTVRTEPGVKRIRVYLAGRLVADTRHPTLVWEIPYYPAYYLPLRDVTAELTPAVHVVVPASYWLPSSMPVCFPIMMLRLANAW